MDIVKEIKALEVGHVIKDILTSTITSYKVGGKAICLVEPNTIIDLKKLVSFSVSLLYQCNLQSPSWRNQSG